jgi:hypothetical protein
VFAAVNVFNHSETAQPGDVFYAEGNWGTTMAVKYELIGTSTTPSNSAATTLALVQNNAANTGTTGSYVAAKIPNSATLGLYAIWMNDGSGHRARIRICYALGRSNQLPDESYPTWTRTMNSASTRL